MRSASFISFGGHMAPCLIHIGTPPLHISPLSPPKTFPVANIFQCFHFFLISSPNSHFFKQPSTTMAAIKINLLFFSLVFTVFFLSTATITSSFFFDDLYTVQKLKHCKQLCKEKQAYQQPDCKRECVGRYGSGSTEEETSEDEQHKHNPYFFDEESFKERFRTQEGNIQVSQRFSQRSNLLQGLDNYRLALLEANPHTFIIPSHFDAEAVLFIVKGRGTIGLVSQEKRESYNVERGDVIRIPAGTTLYSINRDNKEKLQIAELFQSISIPGRYREYIGLAGEEPESFYRTFSSEILEAAFNTPRKQLDRLFGKQNKGIIIKASQEQIKALSQDSGKRREESESESSSGPFNLLKKGPSQCNNYGQLFMIDGNDYKQLQDLDISVGFTNITKGAMMAPFYNSKSTRIVLVVDGKGHVEMACPHLSKQSQCKRGKEQGSPHYQKVSSQLSPRTAFVIPAGHPTSIVASDDDEDLQLVVFGINARNNKRNYLAGRDNIMSQISKEALELGFNVPAKEIEEIFNNQKESFFLPGPHQRQHQRREGGHDHVPLASIMDVIG